METISNQIFENFDDVIEIPEGFISTTWRNNACPSIAREIDANTGVTIWIDYKNPELRETIGEGNRFIVSLETMEEGFISQGAYETLNEAVEKANQIFEENQNAAN